MAIGLIDDRLIVIQQIVWIGLSRNQLSQRFTLLTHQFIHHLLEHPFRSRNPSSLSLSLSSSSADLERSSSSSFLPSASSLHHQHHLLKIISHGKSLTSTHLFPALILIKMNPISSHLSNYSPQVWTSFIVPPCLRRRSPLLILALVLLMVLTLLTLSRDQSFVDAGKHLTWTEYYWLLVPSSTTFLALDSSWLMWHSQERDHFLLPVMMIIHSLHTFFFRPLGSSIREPFGQSFMYQPKNCGRRKERVRRIHRRKNDKLMKVVGTESTILLPQRMSQRIIHS